MKDEDKTKEQLISELAEMRQRVTELETSQTEHKKTEETLHASQEQFRSLFENISDAVAVIKADGTLRYVSPSGENMLGYKEEEVVGRSAFDFVHPDDLPSVMDVYNQGVPIPDYTANIEYRLRHKDGTWRYVEVVAKNLLYDPTVAGIVVTYHDITERKQAEVALRDSEKRYRLLCENVTDVVFTLDMNLKLTFVTPSVTRTTGYSIEETMARSLEQILTPASLGVAMKALGQEMALEEMEQEAPSRSRTLGLEVNCKDGSTVWTEVKMTFLRGPDGRPVGILGVIRDISERKQAEESLAVINHALRTIRRCSQSMVRAKEESELLYDICHILVGVGGYRLAWVGFAEQDEEKTVSCMAHAGYEEGYFDTLNITWSDSERSRGPTGTAIRTGNPSIYRNVLTNPDYAPWRPESVKLGYASLIALPLITAGHTFGALNIYALEPDAFQAEEVELLTQLAGDLAYVVTTPRLRPKRSRAGRKMRRKPRSAFSESQLALLHLIARGMTNREIANQLSRSENTIKTRVVTIFKKLGVHTRSEAVSEAYRRKFILGQ